MFDSELVKILQDKCKLLETNAVLREKIIENLESEVSNKDLLIDALNERLNNG